MRKWVVNGLVVIVSLVVALAACEAILSQLPAAFAPDLTRIHPERRYELRPGHESRSYGAPVRINSRGLRDGEREVCLRAGCVRIGVFGDSMTFGPSVALEETFTHLLETQLRRDAGIEAQVFNFGVPSYNTRMEYLQMRDVIDTYKLDVVILQYTAANDAVVMDQDELSGALNRRPVLRALKDFFRHLHLYHLASRYYFVLRRDSANAEGPALDEFAAGLRSHRALYRPDAPGWREVSAAFRDIATLARTKGASLVLAIHSSTARITRNPADDPYREISEAVAAGASVAGIGHRLLLDDCLRGYADDPTVLWVRPDDSHFSPLAHREVARCLFDYLSTNRLVPELSPPPRSGGG